MGRRCSVCGHPSRAALDLAIINGTASFRVLSRRFAGVSVDAISRHAKLHLADQIRSGQEAHRRMMVEQVAIKEREEANHNLDLDREVARLYRLARHDAVEGHVQNDLTRKYRGMAHAIRLLDLHARINGRYSPPQEGPGQTNNLLLVSPQFAPLVQLLQKVAGENPTVRQQLLEGLEQLEVIEGELA
jgi:hypothetical protein